MLKIRLQRIGRKNDPAFRVVVTESTRGPKSGNHRELLGSYDPRQNTKNLKADRIQYWIGQGAQVSGTVHNLLVTEKIIEGAKVNVLPKKSPIVKEKQEEAAEKTAASSESDTAKTEKAAEGGASTENASSGPTSDEETPEQSAPEPTVEEKEEKEEKKEEEQTTSAEDGSEKEEKTQT